ncbi:MAG: hypothetical protein IJ695_10355 [Butyrivibrio sp.]|nr:hypothetical protein [Butyrivibrio sp.]
MDRETATKLFELHKLEKEYGRGVYPEELHAHGVCTKSQVGPLIENLMETFSVIEENVQGANTYRLSNIGLAHLESYLDFKREL